MTANTDLTATTAQSSPPSPDQVVIKCMGLSKTFRDFWLRNRVRAVDRIDLEVRAGEVFGLLGPNGSGKSTTIKLILGLLQPTAGRMAVFGKRPEDVATKNLIGYLPEESYLYPFLNARETLDYYGRLFHQNRPQRQKRIDMLLKMVGLEAVQRRPIREYSKGMQRRIGLAQALINDPQLLILDEPTTGMDPLGTQQIKNLIHELSRHGKTVLLCSHLLGDVEDVCDRVAIMYGGRIIEEGDLDHMLTEHHTTMIQTPQLDAETIEQIETLLAQRGQHIDKIDQPRQTLESKFLDLVKREQEKGTATSGAAAGGRIAQFLTTGDSEQARAAHLPEDTDAASVIDELMGQSHAAESPPPTPPPAEHKVEQKPDDDMIDDLLRESPQPAAAPEPAPPQPAEDADEQLIDSLIDKPKDNPSSGSD